MRILISSSDERRAVACERRVGNGGHRLQVERARVVLDQTRCIERMFGDEFLLVRAQPERLERKWNVDPREQVGDRVDERL